MAFSRSQQVALAVAPKITAALSMLGSSWIVVEVLTQRTKRENVYNRLLCAMSIVDVITASCYFASTWPIPEGTEGVAFSVGNQNTCITQGFFLQLGIAAPVYNSCLAVYYLLVVKFGVSEERLRYNIEPAMHLLALSFGLLTAIPGVFLDLYNNSDFWCWIAPYPAGCEESTTEGEITCIRGDNFWIYRWAFFFAPLWFCIFFITVIMASVYRTVRRRELDSLGSMGKEQRNDQRRSSVLKQSDGSAMKRKYARNGADGVASKRRSSVVGDRSEMMTRGSSIVMPKTLAMRLSIKSDKSVRTLTAQLALEDANHVLETIETFTSAKLQNVEANAFGSRVVFRQSVLYTVAFYATFTFATINRVLQEVNGSSSSPYPLLVLHAIFVPLQGFFNVLIYRYAFFQRLKQRHPEMSFWERFHLTYRWSFLGPPPDTTARSNVETEASRDNTATSTSRGSAVASGEGAQARAASDDRNSDDTSVHDDDVGFTDGALDPSGDKLMSTVMEDLLMSYAEFPNMLAEESVMVSTQYPTMIWEDSYSGMAVSELSQPFPISTSQAPQAFQTMMTDF